MGPCQWMLSWSNFRRVLFEILQAEFKLGYSQKVCFEVSAMMTFRSHAGGNMEWSFGDHLSTPKAEFWWVGPLEVIISVGWKTICRIPQHFLPPLPNATCWKSTKKWKVELTCDSGFRNQSSCCLFQTTTSARRQSNWRETIGALRCLYWTWISWPTKFKEAWNDNTVLVMSNFMDKCGC